MAERRPRVTRALCNVMARIRGSKARKLVAFAGECKASRGKSPQTALNLGNGRGQRGSSMAKRPEVTRDSAEMLAIQVLNFLAEDPERLSRFLAFSGIEAQSLRDA